MSTPVDFHSNQVQNALRSWWEGLSENRGDRAELRRCRSIDRVLLTEAYHKLRKRVESAGLSFSDDQLATATGLLAHVDDHAEGWSSLASQMAGGENDAPVSGLRFRRLLRREDREDLYRSMIRIIRLLDRRVNVFELANNMYYWGPGVRKRWAQDYYQHALEEA
jgi:CRISPR system Cascade subunit CasB